MLAVIMAGLVIITVEILIPRTIIALGNVDSWWSPFRTLPPPGEMYILVRGDPSGPFDNVIESVVGFSYDNNTHLFTEDMDTHLFTEDMDTYLLTEDMTLPPEDTEGPTLPPEDYLSHLGVTWVGFWRYFLWREVRYDKWEKLPSSSAEWGLVSKVRGLRGTSGHSPSIFFRYNMATEIKGAETVGNFPVDGIVVFTIQIHNPIQAFFFAGGWEAQTNAAVQSVFREYVSTKTIEKLRTEQVAGANRLVELIKQLSGENSDKNGLRSLFGIEIIDARFVQFDLVGGDEAMTKAIRVVEIETLNAEAAAKRGEGEKRERENRAAGVRVEVEAWGVHPVGGQVAMAEAIRVAKPNVLGGSVMVGVEAKR